MIPTKVPEQAVIYSPAFQLTFRPFATSVTALPTLGITCTVEKLHPTSTSHTFSQSKAPNRIYDRELVRFTVDKYGETNKIFRLHGPVLSHPRICNLPACLPSSLASRLALAPDHTLTAGFDLGKTPLGLLRKLESLSNI